MWVYALKKGLFAVPVILAVSVAVFLVMHATPGDPARLMAGMNASQEDVEGIREKLGLNDPLHVQYFRFITNAVRGDFGTSYRTNRPVGQELTSRFPNTVELAVAALVVAVIIGIPFGVLSAVKHNTLTDNFSMLGALLGVSMPSFWLGLMLMLVFAYYLKIFPVSGRGGPVWTLQGLHHLVLPAVSLGAASAATIARMTRSNMLEVLGEDYIRTARAKGLGERVVIYKHALRNAMIPVITIVGLTLGFLLGGTVIIETVFAWPGVGTLIINGIWARDYPMVQAGVFLIAIIFVLMNLLVDLTYGFLNPRISYD